MDDPLKRWLRCKTKGRTDIKDDDYLRLRQGGEERPAYLQYTALERWEALRRLVTSRGRGKTRHARARALLPLPRLKNTLGALLPTPQPAGKPEPKAEKPLDTFYTKDTPPEYICFDLTQPGDEVLALHSLMQYRRALECYNARMLDAMDDMYQ